MHVLGTPPAFVLSQDQTLRNITLRVPLPEGSRTILQIVAVTQELVSSLGMCTLFGCQRAEAKPTKKGQSPFGLKRSDECLEKKARFILRPIYDTKLRGFCQGVKKNIFALRMPGRTKVGMRAYEYIP